MAYKLTGAFLLELDSHPFEKRSLSSFHYFLDI